LDTKKEDEKKPQDLAKFKDGSDNESLKTGSNRRSKAPIEDGLEKTEKRIALLKRKKIPEKRITLLRL
jgi:hypothetical protein